MRNGSNTLIVFIKWLNRLELFLLHIFYCIWCLFCFWFHFYAVTLRTFVRFETTDLTEHHLSYTELKKSLEIFWPATRKKTEVWRINSVILLNVKRIIALSDILAPSSSWKIANHETGLNSLNKLYLTNLHDFYSWLSIFKDTLLPKLVFVNKSCCLLKCFIELHFSWLFVKILSYRFAGCFQS